jgi:SnoaL-like domain
MSVDRSGNCSRCQFSQHTEHRLTPSIDRQDGRQQVEESFRSMFETTRKQSSGPPYLHIEPSNVLVQMQGEAAPVTFEFDRSNGSLGRRTIVFCRRRGVWKIVHIHASNVTRR